jgi:clan AA aspartic protease (TIGR02281 family)
MNKLLLAGAAAIALSACAAPSLYDPSLYHATTTPPSHPLLYHDATTPPSPSYRTAIPTTDYWANGIDQLMTIPENACQQGNLKGCVMVSELFAARESCRHGDSVACQRGLIALNSKMCQLGSADACRDAAKIAEGPPPKSSATLASTHSATGTHVPLTRTPGGSLIVAASINGSAPIRFTLDSGAESLVLPSSMARQLARQGIITQAEFLGSGVSELANGSQTRDWRFRLHSVTLGGIVVHDIYCAVVDGDGGALLGQAVLSKLRSWKIDNERQTLDIS